MEGFSKMFLQTGFFGFLVSMILFLGGCSTSSVAPEAEHSVESSAEPVPSADDNSTLGDSDSGKAMGLETVHFAFDSNLLDKASKSTLSKNAAILKQQLGLQVQIEGHCSPEGGIQYNIALGERRANAAKKYLIDQGVSQDRITVISFGKEKLLDTGSSPDAFARNRRANFVITSTATPTETAPN